MNNKKILEGLGFVHEYDGTEWNRWRHNLADEHDKEFALIIWNSYSENDVLEVASKMLRKVGQQQKIDQITKFID